MDRDESCEMRCPECKSPGPFESTRQVVFRPVIENWVFDRAPSVLFSQRDFNCLNCESRLRIDVRSKSITAIKVEPVFDEYIEQLLKNLRQDPDGFVEESTIEEIRRREFRGVNRLMNCRTILSKIIEQRL